MGMRTFCGIIMRKQVRADVALLAAMVKTFPGGSNPEEVIVNRFALAGTNDPGGGKSTPGSPVRSNQEYTGNHYSRNSTAGPAVYQDETVAGTFNGRIDHLSHVHAGDPIPPGGVPQSTASRHPADGPAATPIHSVSHAASGNKFIFRTDTNQVRKISEKYILKSLYKNILNYILKYIYQDPWNLRGDFVAAAYDITEDRLVLARDLLGTRPLYFLEQPDYIAFATEIKALKALPGFAPQVDETWIADALSTVKSEKWRTPYTGIRRVRPGHLLVYDRTLREERYLDLELNGDVAGMGYEQAVELFREKLLSAVYHRIKDDRIIAAELSGGLDSSGVTAIANQLAQQSGQSLVALTHAFSDKSLGKFFPYGDEREFSMEVTRHAGLSQHVMCDADGYGLLDMLKRNIVIQSGPTQQGYSMFSDTLYDRGKERGVTKILSGFGGDEGVTSKAGGFFEEMAAQGRWDLFRKEIFLRGNQTGKQQDLLPDPLHDTPSGAYQGTHFGTNALKDRMRKEAAYVVYRYFPFAKKFLRDLLGRADWRKEKYPGLGFTKAFEAQMGIRERFYQRLGFPDDPDVRARQYKRIMHDHVSQRFEYSYLDARTWGIEYAYPLWDIDLLAFYYSLPPEYKYRNGMGRAIYRDAMRGILPDKIRLRNDKTGATVPTVQQRFMHDDKEITALINRSRANNRYHYLDYDRMLAWQERLRQWSFRDNIPANPAAFFNSLQVLLLQEMEREGTYRSGIRW